MEGALNFDPGHVRYIKLGPSGAWARDAFADGTLPFMYREVDHTLCMAGDWDKVRAELIRQGRKGSAASDAVRELRDYYDLGADCLWITFADGHLWWAFAATEVEWLGDRGERLPARQRRVIGEWRRTSLDGTPLPVRSLSSALTRTAGYRKTICTVEQQAYLLRRISGETDPLTEDAAALQAQLCQTAATMVRDLDWRDFEILIDLIFTRAGWRRQSALGQGEVDVDLLLDHPTTGELAWVQIKTGTSQAELADYVKRFEADGSCEHFFFVCHGDKGALRLPEQRSRYHLWLADEVAARAIEVGLLDWLIARRA
jgi:hypothetical protein